MSFPPWKSSRSEEKRMRQLTHDGTTEQRDLITVEMEMTMVMAVMHAVMLEMVAVLLLLLLLLL